MNFTKGALLGIIAGTIVGVMNKDSIMSAVNNTKREVRRMKRKYNMF